MVVSGVTVEHRHVWAYASRDCNVACSECGHEPDVPEALRERDELLAVNEKLRASMRAVEERVGRALILLRGP